MGHRVVVTGGAGVIGQELVAMLRRRGDSVRVVDRLPRPSGFDKDVDFIQGDLVDLDSSAIAGFDPELIFHLAAAFERSEENPEFWTENAHDNVVASQRVLSAACAAPSLRRYVFASSYLVYDVDRYLRPEPPTRPIALSEDGPIDPRNACGAAKLLHEKEAALASQSDTNDFTVVSARIYRVYGRSSRDVISRWVRAALAGEGVRLYGPESFFDYIHARDVAEGLWRLASADIEGSVNLGTGRARRVRTVVDCLLRHFPDLEIEGPHPAEAYEASQADLARFEKATKWRPRISLEEGVAELVEHERQNLERDAVSARVVPGRRAVVVVSSLSWKVSLVRAVRDAFDGLLLKGTVIGADADPSLPTRMLVDEFWEMGPLDQLSDDEICAYCRSKGVTLLIPTRDGELLRYASLRDRLLAAGTFVPIGSPASIEASIDKVLTAQRCQDAGIPAIPTATAVDALETDRFVVKERFGAGARSIGVDLDRAAAVSFATRLAEPVFQPFIDGQEFSVDCYIARDGRVVGTCVRRRTVVVHGESQVTTTVSRPDIAELAAAALGALDVRGHAVLQAIDSAAGPVILEINSRVGGASATAFAAGLRSIDQMLREALAEPLPEQVVPKAGVTLTRLPKDILKYG